MTKSPDALSFDGLEVAAADRPKTSSCRFDLDRALSSVVAVHARVPSDAYTAEALGTERVGNGVVVREDGVVLTIGYLITEAEAVTLTTADGRAVPAHPLGVDGETGFGLLQALEPLQLPAVRIGDSSLLAEGEPVVVAGAGGARHAVAARLVARRPFAGYWEYALDEALFTAPAHPHWSGAAILGPDGALVGLGSLQVEQQADGRPPLALNMSVPAELLPPVFDALLAGGGARPSRPWLGLFAQEIDGQVTIIGHAGDGPARRAGLDPGDVVLAVAGEPVDDLGLFYRRVWALGPAGVDVPLTLEREGDVFDVTVTSADRRKRLKARRYH